VIDVSDATFESAVIGRSRSVPVVVDFWAAWCAPCRMLGPILEREVARRDGAVELAKLDVDSNPRTAQTFGIQGIPAVKAFHEGRVVDEFVGALPAAAVSQFLDKLAPSRAELLVRKGDEGSLRQALELEPGRADAAVPLARLLYRRGETEEALDILNGVPGSFAADGLAARIRLENAGADGLAPAFVALDAGDYDRGMDVLLSTIRPTHPRRDEIRRVVVGILDELGPDDPRVPDWRRRMTSSLY
jgi:putative thioredoxin